MSPVQSLPRNPALTTAIPPHMAEARTRVLQILARWEASLSPLTIPQAVRMPRRSGARG